MAQTQEEKILYEIERRGGFITTYELMDMRISQYQARLAGLRAKLAAQGKVLTEGIPVEGKKGCFMYKLLSSGQRELVI